jgi:hypothetical protein
MAIVHTIHRDTVVSHEKNNFRVLQPTDHETDDTVIDLHLALSQFYILISGTLFILASIITIRNELYHIANTRGYNNPIPLSKTGDGWIALSNRPYTMSLLLGRVEATPPSLDLLSGTHARTGSAFCANRDGNDQLKMQIISSASFEKQIQMSHHPLGIQSNDIEMISIMSVQAVENNSQYDH